MAASVTIMGETGKRWEDSPAMASALTRAARHHWPEYLMEGAGLALFMISATLVTMLLEHPASPLRQAVPDAFNRRLLTGCAMGATAIALIYSPWGARSGAHLNPSTTVVFWRLGKVATPDAVGYVVAQFAGGVAGVLLVSGLFARELGAASVRYAATVPGGYGTAVAFAAETAISFILITTVLRLSNASRTARYTGLAAGLLVACFITFEAPLSGMSMNPARTFASAAAGHIWTALWVYFSAPPLGMLLAAEVHVRLRGSHPVLCAKLHHGKGARCIFRCGYGPAA
jgi:aquaporin Z